MMMPFILAGLGLLLIFLEFYLPSGFLVVLGGILIIGSVVSIAVQTESVLIVALFIVGLIVAITVLIRFTLWKIRHTSKDYSIYSDNHQTGYVASTFDKDAIGKEGVVVSDLKPGGHIIVDGKRHQALSQSGYLTKGSEVVVVGGEGESLIVKHKKKIEG